MKTEDYLAREDKYLAKNYHPLPVVLTKGEGVWVWDADGQKYLDFLSAYSAVSAGHLNKRIKKALMDQMDQMDVPSRAFYTDKLGAFAEKLCGLTGMDKMLPMNTGAEAVETAIKAARRWGYKVKGIAKDKARIIVSSGNFHGRTTTIVGFSSDEDYRDGFGPFDGGFDIVPFGDIEALEKAITPETCAFLTEPIQGEGGIIMPPAGWLKQVQALCRKHNILFILDEIQSGIGRTGKDFAFQHEIDKPDALLLGKALGGGVYPVSAFLARKDVMDVFDPGSHGSTFGGNPIAAAVGLEALNILEDEDLSGKSHELGEYLKGKLAAMNSPLVTEIRGKGLWIGVDIDPAQVSAREVCERLRHKGLLCKETHETVVRFAPPLTITKEEIDWAVEQVQDVLAEIVQSGQKKAV
ncbi:MAG: ornithine--oxo-acid transaminase [Rhodospirillales bacterium]|nr:ornithine--oxo-acid transaminase [Rhodospirillales bacterium]MCB9995733.1 ornithine--oxo-acid transaminase [Rhodospirillales bacterium]